MDVSFLSFTTTSKHDTIEGEGEGENLHLHRSLISFA
jgi:hypothetical protein